MRTIFPTAFALALIAAFVCGCSSVDMPKGTDKGYESARFVKASSATLPYGLEDSPVVNGMVQDAIATQFRGKGFTFGGPSADLIVAYMLIRQTNSSTAMNADHFGHGRDVDAIVGRAHDKGVIKNKSPDEFEAGAVVIDILDARSNELVYRNFAKREVIDVVSDEARRQRIDGAVREALAPFFK